MCSFVKWADEQLILYQFKPALSMKKQVLTLSLLSGLIAFNACKKDAVDYAAQATCTGTTPTYSGEVESILNTNCALSGCIAQVQPEQELTFRITQMQAANSRTTPTILLPFTMGVV
jgi:hypothetical protein